MKNLDIFWTFKFHEGVPIERVLHMLHDAQKTAHKIGGINIPNEFAVCPISGYTVVKIAGSDNERNDTFASVFYNEFITSGIECDFELTDEFISTMIKVQGEYEELSNVQRLT